MPYINEADRNIIDPELVRLMGAVEEIRAVDRPKPLTPEAAINYIICQLFDQWFQGGYSRMAQGLGAIQAAQLEIYRRRVAPYEDKALRANGDVFGSLLSAPGQAVAFSPEAAASACREFDPDHTADGVDDGDAC